MVMTVYGQNIPCTRVEKGTDFVRAYDESGVCVFESSRVADFSGYTLDGGTWNTAEPSAEERIEELEALVAQLLFGGEDA